jgi:nicotinamide mononucleotide transporter
MTTLEIVAVVVSFAGIWLTARRHMLCWPVNLVACALYAKLFLAERLYADMVLQMLFGIAIVYGWVAWARGTDSAGEVVVTPLRPTPALAGLAAGAAGAAAIGWLTSHHTDAALPWMDATLSSFSLVAQYWTARRHAASWLLWIVVDTCYVGMFVWKGLLPTAGLYAAMIGLAVIGYRQWRQAGTGRGDAPRRQA